MPLRQGIENATVRGSSKVSSGNKTTWFKWAKDGDSKHLRLLTDPSEAYVVYQHPWVQTHDGGHRTFICAEDMDRDCELCAAGERRSEKIYGLAVERETASIKRDGKTVLGFVDKFEEYEDEGKTKERPVIGVLVFSKTNFWDPLAEYQKRLGTLKERDVEIIKKGEGINVNYMPMLSPVDDPLDLSVYEEFKPDLKAIIEFMGSEEYYAKHLHGIETPKGETPKKAASSRKPVDLEVTEWDELAAAYSK